MREPGIRADHEQHVAVLDILRGMTRLRAEQMSVDPEITGLFLGQRVEHMA